MNQPTRLDPVTPAETVPRQTPKRDFGSMLAENIGGVFSKGASLVSRAFGSVPLLSTAVSGVNAVAQTVGLARGGVFATAAPQVRGVSWVAGSGNFGGLDSPMVHDLMAKIEAGSDLTPSEYLVLQRAMQQENQQYTAASNILKVRADSAKAAINNIR